MNIIEINHQNTYEYFEPQVVDEIFDHIHKEINKHLSILPKIGIGCMCFPDVPIKKLGAKNVYVEYHYEAVGSPNQIPIPIKLKPHSVIIFEGMPPEIEQKIEKVKKIISDYPKLN